MKSNFHGGGPLDPPTGQVTVENPDGVIKTYGAGEARSNLLAGTYVHGGPDACAYGAFRDESDGLPAYDPPMPMNRIRVG